MKESYLQKKIKESIEEAFGKDVVVYNIHGGQYQEAGIPDLLVCLMGKFVGLEIKVKDQYDVTEIQKYQIGRINRAWGHAIVVYSVDDAINYLNNLL